MNNFADTLVAPKVSDYISEEQNIFAPLIGDWDFVMVYHPGTANEKKVEGEWFFSWVLGGYAVQDVFVCPRRSSMNSQIDNGSIYGSVFRVYSKIKKCWEVFSTCNGSSLIMDARKVGENIVLDAITTSKYKVKRIFSNITENSFKWQIAVSSDNGHNWIVFVEMSAVRKQTNIIN